MRKLLFLLIAICAAVEARAADRYLISDAGCSAIWTDTDCWGSSSGAGAPQTAPTASDACFFDAASAAQNMALNGATRACLSVTVTGWTGTLAFGANDLNVAGNVTLDNTMTITGTGCLGVTTTASLTADGLTFPGCFANSTSSTVTFVDTWVITGNFTASGSNPVMNSTAGTVSVGGSVAFSVMTTGTATGTIALVMNGTGTLSAASITTGSVRINITINTAGTITFANGGTWRYQTGTFTYTTGTIVCTNNTFVLTAAATITTNASGFCFGTLSVLGGNQTFNGTDGWTAAALSQLVAAGTLTFQDGETYSVTSSLILTATAASHVTLAASAGTVNLNFSGSTVALVYANFTNVVASGAALQTYQGTLSGTTTGITQTTTIPTGSGSLGGRIIG
jgi:hypothetical protein